jgi:hypothetical protein
VISAGEVLWRYLEEDGFGNNFNKKIIAFHWQMRIEILIGEGSW